MHGHLKQKGHLQGTEAIKAGPANSEIWKDGRDGVGPFWWGGEKGARIIQEVGIHDAVEVDKADIAG